MRSVSTRALVATLMTMGTACGAQAQTTPPASTPAPAEVTQGLADIVVTAEKRSTSLQRTPVAVTALDGEALAKAQVSDLRNFSALVPGFKAADTGGFSQITIRGIGIQNFTPLAESAVAVNVNDVYVSRPSSFMTSMFDISSVEVLRGPQGTLYGRNATAGSVNMTTTRPGDNLSGYVRLVGGNFQMLRGEAAIGGPVIDGLLSVRIAGFAETRDGYGRNVTTGSGIDDKKAQGLRGTIVLTPAPDLKITGIAEYYNEDDKAGGYHYFGPAGLLPVSGAFGTPPFAVLFGGTVPQNSYNTADNDDPFFKLRTTTLTGIVEYGTGPFSFKSITGYRDQNLSVRTDIDASNLQLGLYITGEPAHQFSQEFQFQYDTDRLHLTVGAYYFDETDAAVPSVAAFSSQAVDPVLASLGIVLPPRAPVFLNFANLGGTIRTEAKAVFAQASYELVDGLTAVAGIRYSSDKKRLDSRYLVDLFTPFDPNLPPPASLSIPAKSFNSWTPKFGLQYQISPRTMVYATYAKGFKAGSFDPAADPATTTSLSYDPENLTSYELGLKTTAFGGKVRANVAAFYYDYSDLQVSQTRGLGIVTENAGKARVYGLEGEFTFLPVESFQLSLNGSYLNAKYTNYVGADAARPLLPAVDFSGNRLNNAPEWSGAVSAQYTAAVGTGELVLRVEGELTSKYFFSPGNYDLAGQAGYAKANAFITYRLQDGLSVTGFMRNITDERTRTSAFIGTPFLGTAVLGSLAPPRTFGLELSYRM